MLLIISGHNRSGTTLTHRLCDSHPDINLTNEFGGLLDLKLDKLGYCRQIIRRWWKAQNRPFFRGDRLWAPGCYDQMSGAKREGSPACMAAKLTRIYMVQNGYFVLRYLIRIVRDSRRVINGPAVEAALQAVANGRRIVGDNFPDYMYSLDKLVKVDGLACILVYRDPRDVASDILKRLRPRRWLNETTIEHDLRKWWPKRLRTAETIARRWVTTVSIMERHADTAFLIKYETLVTNPRPLLKRLGAWLEVDPAGFRHQIIKPGGHIGVYRQGLSRQELADVIRVAGPTLERLGYEI